MLQFDADKYDFWKIYESIKRYYPLGVNRESPEFFISYPGIKDLDKLIADNIHNNQNYHSRWGIFTSELSRILGKEITGTTYGQAPSFSAFVLLETIIQSDSVRTKELHFFLSLIGPYYTVLCQDKNLVKAGDSNFVSTNHLLVSPEGTASNAFQLVCDKIEDQFKGYRFVPFTLCKQTIEGLRVRYSEDKLDTIFHALFNNHVDLTTGKVAGDDFYKSGDWVKEGYIDTGARWVAYPPGLFNTESNKITYTTSTTDKDLLGIQNLQKKNLPHNLTEKEIKSQGFVTVIHTLEDLKMLNDYEKHLIIKDNEEIIGYILAMTKNSKNDIPILIPMFNLFDKIHYKGQFISEYNYIVVGQVCIDKDYRGLGLIDKSYANYKANFKEKYNFAITEISVNNLRSLKAHERIGFVELHKYTDTNNIDWSVVIWDWNDPV